MRRKPGRVLYGVAAGEPLYAGRRLVTALRDNLPRSFRVWTCPPDRWGVYYQRRQGKPGWSFHVNHDVVLFKLRLSWQSSKANERRRYEEYRAMAVASMAAERERARVEFQSLPDGGAIVLAAPTPGGD